MTNLATFLPQAEQVAALIDDLMIEELGLMAPAAYELNSRDQRVYLVASYDPLMLGRSLKAYENPEIARRLRTALAMPVRINRDTGTRYVVLMHGVLSLPKKVDFPIEGAERDVFRLGIGLKGEVKISARNLRNILLGAGQGMGKSSIEHLLAFQMLGFGWQLYLADPQSHTFNPDVWNRAAAMPVADSQDDMLRVLEAIESEMADRIFKFRAAAVNGIPPADIDAYNAQGMAPMPRIGFLIDEANFFLDSKSILRRLADLLRQGRKWGLHIVIGGHEWHKENVPAAVNDLLQTRIALNSLSGAVVLRNYHWGKWVEGRPPGRGVLKTNTFEPMQFYLVSDDPLRGRLINAGDPEARLSPIPAQEADLVRRALAEADGKMTRELLVEWGMSQDDARELGARYEARGWLVKDPRRGNARLVAEALIAIVDEFYPPTHQPHQPTNQGISLVDSPPTLSPTPPTQGIQS